MSSDDLPDRFLSDAEFHEVIARAARYSADVVPVDVARAVAQDLGLDPHAVERALREVLLPTPTSLPAPRGHVRRAMSAIAWRIDTLLPREGLAPILASIGGALGWLSGRLAANGTGSNAVTDVPIVAGLALLTLVLSVSRRRGRRFAEYLTESATLWASFAATWGFANGSDTDDLLRLVAIALTGATAWGWLVVRRRGERLDVSGEVTPVPGR